MIVHEGYNGLSLRTPSVTLGIFDGVHRGHMTLLKRLTDSAGELHGESVVVTFSPHPKLVLDKETKSLFFLTTLEEKQNLLEKAGVDHLVVIRFDREFSAIPACDFVKNILVDRVGTKHLILGFNHHFGNRGEGDFKTIRECASANDFTVEQAQGLHTEEGAISSSLIRDALMNGRLDDANTWLGYNYTLTGTVVKGKQLGREIGFPTANIEPDYDHKLVPGTGVYAVEVIVEETFFPGMMSIGTNPTVNRDPFKRTIEVHILGFSGDIYGRKISVIFRKRLRNEERFNSTEELARQMELDKHQVIQLFDRT
jgi:riboflavin kinase/FMN adenylyltransferase